MDLSVFYAGLLTAPSAAERVWGVDRWAEYLGDDAHLLPLLDDDAPVVRSHAARRMLVEVRAVALVALQDRHRGARHGWPYGPVVVRRAMPVDDATAQARAALDTLDPAERDGVTDRVAATLAERVGPPPGDADACRAYCTLLALGLVPHEVQEVDPATLLTPLQVAVHRSQLVSPRPVPHLRFDGPDGPVGYLYREATWVHDLDESPLGRDVARFLEGLFAADRPRWTAATPSAADDLAHLRDVATSAARFCGCTVVTDGA
ncbi:hypothetical protein [Kineosporia sp. A_224]|uniref:hypothetical protein n=1 Tax=Kineosporia sp. A_224 TaxID=1962180 RepID=UPI000B4B1451|nr:hypothetical protein [Kineosporia sp. A_224]